MPPKKKEQNQERATAVKNQKEVYSEMRRQQDQSLRNDCLKMALDFHRSVENKYNYSVDVSALENINDEQPKKRSKFTVNDSINLFNKEGILVWKSATPDGYRVGAAISEIGKREVPLAIILATADKLYKYILSNKK